MAGAHMMMNEADGRRGWFDSGEAWFGGRGRKTDRGGVPITAILAAVLRKSAVMCSVEPEGALDIDRPTNVRHVSHVTFDRFNGFLGLPVEFEPDLPRRVPSASASVFGVSPESMQCSYDGRGNVVPTILLLMQQCLYSQGGLQAEGIFRINPENGQEEYVRGQLNRGSPPYGVDVHCLADLIKAWFRELPRGVLDSLTPEQVMHCHTEAECIQLVQSLPPTEAALFDWAINLMADVVQYEHQNKMNARNIAVVFAPNMTQMSDPLTALIHAVQVMNFLKTLILRTLQDREESVAKAREFSFSLQSPSSSDSQNSSGPVPIPTMGPSNNSVTKDCFSHGSVSNALLRNRECGFLSDDAEESFSSVHVKYEADDEYEPTSSDGPLRKSQVATIDSEPCREYGTRDGESLFDRLNFRRGVRKICKHPVFHLNRAGKKNSGFVMMDPPKFGQREAWA